MGSIHEITVSVNGVPRTCRAPARTSLADFLREKLGLTGTHLGCEHGVCGCCTVLLDGEPVRSCIVLAAQADGHEVITVEGLAGPGGQLSLLQKAFCEAHALQCGYCTPGMLIAAHALLERSPCPARAEIDEAIGGNICRCTGYVQIREAIELAARKRQRAGPPPVPGVPGRGTQDSSRGEEVQVADG
jgi:aerobic-type carbon monoxide dehydrogenase small subunit (CoxS/CutS family)